MPNATLTIASGNTTSDTLQTSTLFGADKHYSVTEEFTLALIDCPATLPSITSLGLQYSEDGSTWRDLKDEFGTAVAIAVSASASVTADPRITCILPLYLRLKSNVAASGGNRAFVLHFRKV